VAAYSQTGELFSVAPGDRTVVGTGLQSFIGAVTRIEPVAAVSPGEFRGAFATTDRRQLFRIAFNPGQSPRPLFAKVRVRSASLALGRSSRTVFRPPHLIPMERHLGGIMRN
jgi:hypothetical protein